MTKSPKKSSQGMSKVGNQFKSKQSNSNKQQQHKTISSTSAHSRRLTNTVYPSLNQNLNRIKHLSQSKVTNRHSDPLPKSLFSPKKTHIRRSLPLNNLTVNSVRVPITSLSFLPPKHRFLNNDITKGLPQLTSDEDAAGGGGQEEADDEDDADSDDDDSSSSSEDDSSSEGESQSQTNLPDQGFDVVDPAFVNKKLRQLKKGPLLQKSAQEAQEIELAFEKGVARSKDLFIGFLGGTITEELLKGFESMESVLSAGVRLYDQKKRKHLDKFNKDFEKLEQNVLKFAEINKKILSGRQILSGSLQTSRDIMEKEIVTHRKDFENGCKAVQSKGSSNTKKTGGKTKR